MEMGRETYARWEVRTVKLPCSAPNCKRARVRNGLCVFHARQADTGVAFTDAPAAGRRGARSARFRVSGGVAEVLLVHGGGSALVDIEAIPLLRRSRFQLDRRGRTSYARCVSGDFRGRYLHQVIMGSPPTAGLTVDHIDGNGLNNTARNLRWASPREQATNRRPRQRTGAMPC
jgi:hypothetical protein